VAADTDLALSNPVSDQYRLASKFFFQLLGSSLQTVWASRWSGFLIDSCRDLLYAFEDRQSPEFGRAGKRQIPCQLNVAGTVYTEELPVGHGVALAVDHHIAPTVEVPIGDLQAWAHIVLLTVGVRDLPGIERDIGRLRVRGQDLERKVEEEVAARNRGLVDFNSEIVFLPGTHGLRWHQ
jgi:hypothetical protein